MQIKKNYFLDDEHYNSNSILNYLDDFTIHNKEFKPYISHKTGFGLTLLEGNNAHIHSYTSSKSEVYLCLEGEWEITCNDKKVLIGSRDAFSPPKNSTRSLKNISSDKGSIYIVRQKN